MLATDTELILTPVHVEQITSESPRPSLLWMREGEGEGEGGGAPTFCVEKCGGEDRDDALRKPPRFIIHSCAGHVVTMLVITMFAIYSFVCMPLISMQNTIICGLQSVRNDTSLSLGLLGCVHSCFEAQRHRNAWFAHNASDLSNMEGERGPHHDGMPPCCDPRSTLGRRSLDLHRREKISCQITCPHLSTLLTGTESRVQNRREGGEQTACRSHRKGMRRQASASLSIFQTFCTGCLYCPQSR